VRAFDLLQLADWDVSKLPLIERKAPLEPLVANKPGLQFNGHATGSKAETVGAANNEALGTGGKRDLTAVVRRGIVRAGRRGALV
jgi:hypothetical protein